MTGLQNSLSGSSLVAISATALTSASTVAEPCWGTTSRKYAPATGLATSSVLLWSTAIFPDSSTFNSGSSSRYSTLLVY